MDKVVAPENDSSIVLQLVEVFGDIRTLRCEMKMLTPFSKLFRGYRRHTGITFDILRFRFNGDMIGENETPASINLSNEDTIEIYMSLIDPWRRENQCRISARRQG